MEPNYRIKTVLFGTKPISIGQFTVVIVAMSLAGLMWMLSINLFERPLPHNVAVTLSVGVPILVLVFTGVATIKYDQGIVTGWLAGTSFFLGFMYLFQDPTLTWYENLHGQLIVSASLTAVGVTVGAFIGFILKRVYLSDSE